jgi:hypothetical protein
MKRPHESHTTTVEQSTVLWQADLSGCLAVPGSRVLPDCVNARKVLAKFLMCPEFASSTSASMFLARAALVKLRKR